MREFAGETDPWDGVLLSIGCWRSATCAGGGGMQVCSLALVDYVRARLTPTYGRAADGGCGMRGKVAVELEGAATKRCTATAPVE